jgi:hypothetical protein
MTPNELAAHNKAWTATIARRAKRDESIRLHHEDSVAYERAYTAFYTHELALLEIDDDEE